MMPKFGQLGNANLQVDGADKVCKQPNRENAAVARCTVEPLLRRLMRRLMWRLGLRGVKRVKGVRNTINDSKAPRPLGKVNRQFRAAGANQRCVSDFT